MSCINAETCSKLGNRRVRFALAARRLSPDARRRSTAAAALERAAIARGTYGVAGVFAGVWRFDLSWAFGLSHDLAVDTGRRSGEDLAMPSNRWSERLALGFAILRGTMLIGLSLVLLIVPERAMPGSTTEPARALALIVVSRTMLLGSVLAGLAIKRSRGALAWVLFADGLLQIIDTGAAVSMGKSTAAVLPAILGILDALAGRVLRRAP